MALIEIGHSKKYFNVTSGVNHAVDDITLKIEEDHTMGIAGESECDKSTLDWTVIRLHKATDGVIRLGGKDITHTSGKESKQIREKAQIIFRDPYAPLNPQMTMEATVQGPLVEAHHFSKTGIARRTEELADRVGIKERLQLSYPHELDGRRRQRIDITRAIALNPELIVCNEPVSALDVSVQTQVLGLLMDLQKECGLTYVFVTHDLSVVRHIPDGISVMYLGQLVETPPAKELFRRTLHPYTKTLLSAIPSVDIHHPMQRIRLKGEVTSAINPKPGCQFAPRCSYAIQACLEPQCLEEIELKHFVSCYRVREINNQARGNET